MNLPIALQLYSVRDLLVEDFEGILTRVAEMGYQGVEPAGFPGTTPVEAKKLFDRLGLVVTSIHSAPPIGEEKNKIIDLMGILESPYLVIPFMPGEDFLDLDGIKRVSEKINTANQVARENGFSLGYHNHWWEAEYLIDGVPSYEVMLEHLDADVFFQVDTYWMKVGGLDVSDVLRKLHNRSPLIHVKDGPGNKEEPMTAVGKGIMDWKAIIPPHIDVTEWFIVEMDRCATDILEAVADSYTYLSELN